MAPTITDFEYRRVPVADGVALHVAIGGTGSPLVLLHGFPQTHLMWRHVARELAGEHTVICPDLRGYGASDKPAGTDETVYAKRTMGNDVVALAAALGHERFALAGHDRGALVGFRTALDHPDRVTRFASLDVVPTLDTWNVLHGVSAAVAFHLYLMAQPPGLPELMIQRSADEFFGHFLDAWSSEPGTIEPEYRAAYLAASARAVPSIVADYRASAGIDVRHDQADADLGRQLRMPVTVIQQDWGAALGYDAAAVWRAWAPDLHHLTTNAGHFMAEQAPAEIAAALRDLLSR
jgi:pimeloyl-ACP methyl ester carboxylesterase